MSFSKSRLDRFGNKIIDMSFEPVKRTSSTEIQRGKCAIKNQGDTKEEKTLQSKSFVESAKTDETASDGTNLKEQKPQPNRPKLTSTRHSCLGSRIGKCAVKSLSRPISRGQAESHQDIPSPRGQTTDHDATSSLIPNENANVNKNISRAGTPITKQRVRGNWSTKSPDFQRRNFEMQFNMKMKKLALIKKELIDKQKPAVDLYKQLLVLRKKIVENEGKEPALDELKIIEYQEEKPEDLEHLKQEDREKLKKLKEKIQNYPGVFLQICRKIVNDKCKIMDNIFNDDGEWNQDEFIQKIQHYKRESKELETQIEKNVKEEEETMKQMIKDYQNLAKTNPEIDETMVHDLELKLHNAENKLKQTIADLQLEKSRKVKDQEKIKDLDRDLNKMKDKVLELNRYLEEEKNKNQLSRERIGNLEQKLRTAKGRMKEAENIQHDFEIKYKELQNHIQTIEEEWKSKENIYESKTNEMRESIQEQSDKIIKLEEERRSVDARCEELQKKLQENTSCSCSYNYENEDRIRELENKLKCVEDEKSKIEKEFDLLRNENVNDEVYNQVFTLCQKNMDENQSIKSDTDMSLWAELQATKSALKLAEEKLALYSEEKARFIETISKEDDDATVTMATHLIQKEELITNLILQNKQLKKSLYETKNELEQKMVSHKTLEDQLSHINNQLITNNNNVQKQNYEIHELHNKLQEEVQRNSKMEQDLKKLLTEKDKMIAMMNEYDNFFTLRDKMVKTIQDQAKVAEEQNKNLKEYIVQMRDQLNTISTEKTKKEIEIKQMTKLLEDKTTYIEKIEERIEELESSVHAIKSKRVNLDLDLNNLSNELRVTKEQIEHLSERVKNKESREKKPKFSRTSSRKTIFTVKKSVSVYMSNSDV